MPVKHDLLKDLSVTPELASKLRNENPHLDRLFEEYKDKDAQIVEAEKDNALGISDAALLKLKEQRLLIKDKIASYFSESSASKV